MMNLTVVSRLGKVITEVKPTATVHRRHKSTATHNNLLDNNRLLIHQAVTFLNERPRAKSHHSINAFIKVNVQKNMPQIRGNLVLPDQVTKKNIRILCFAEGQDAISAKGAGADIIGTADMLELIIENKIQFDLVVSTPTLFPLVTKIGKYLGPKGLMPNVKKGTLTTDVESAIRILKCSTPFSSGKNGNVNMVIGRIGFTPDQVERNLQFVMKNILDWTSQIPGKKRIKKTEFVESVSINATFAPAYPLKLAQFYS